MSSNYFGLMDELVGLSAIWIALLCFAGLYSKAYRDNWLQTIGLSVMLIASFVLVWHSFYYHRATWRAALFVVGVAIYVTGVAWNAWKFRHTPQRPEPQLTRGTLDANA